MPAKTIPAIEKELDVLQSQLSQYQSAVDDAADAGDSATVKDAQASIAATEAMIASAQRRLAKAQAGLTESEKAVQREANAAAVSKIKEASKNAAAAVSAAAKCLDEFVANLHKAHDHGAIAGDAAAELIRQLPEKERREYFSLINGLRFTDTHLAAAVESSMQKAGLFASVAPADWVRLVRHDLPPLDSFIEERVSRLVRTAERVADKATARI